MGQDQLLRQLRDRHSESHETLDAFFQGLGQEAWNKLRGLARRSPGAVDDEAVAWAASRLEQAPGTFFAMLLDLAAKDDARREELVALYLRRLPEHPGPALGSAGYNLHEYNHVLDERWVDAAQAAFDANPDGAWGILESAAMYRPKFVRPEHVDWFEARRAAAPRDYFVVMFSLASHRPEARADLLSRALRAFPEHPAEAVDGASFSARDEVALLGPELIAAMLAHFDAAPEKAWEFFEGACRAKRALFDDALIDALARKAEAAPGTIFSILKRLIDEVPERAAGLLDRYVALLRKHPAAGIPHARNNFSREDVRLVRPDLVRAVCEGFPAAAYPAYEFLWHCVEERGELIGPREVEDAVRNIDHATNRAFGFFRELIKRRPEFAREGVLALFEALSREPAYRAFVRAEELEGITAVSEAAHIRTGLESALREPPRFGSRRARALMAILFRQKLRARRHVLLEALRYAGSVVLWRKMPDGQDSEKYSPIWDFVMFIIDQASGDAISTAAAEQFLEGAFQLHYLCRNGAEHEEFLRKLDLGNPPPQAFPEGARFLDADASIAPLYALVLELGRRFGTEPRLGPLGDFLERRAAAERELRGIEDALGRSQGTRRRRLSERRKAVERQLDCWKDPAFRRAFDDPAAEGALSEDARSLLRREKKDLAKQLRDALRAEAVRLAVAAVERSRLELYRNRLRDALGRDVEIESVEPRILPAFLWFQAIGGFPKNTKGLRRLIEDRIAKRPHDWLRAEPAAQAWEDRVRAAQPGFVPERWRAPFSRELQYRPKDALAEKRRRIKADLAQARALLDKAGAEGLASEKYDDLARKLEELRRPPPKEKDGEEKRAPADPALLEEVAQNLERVRIAEQTPDSDFEGRLTLEVESDPFEILFMGEYGFASCLSLRGSNAWSAVSNAIDADKTIVWAREPGGNVVGRRLIALIPDGLLTFRTYTNRHGLALDRAFDEFIAAYAAHCGVPVTRAGKSGPLLSDRWYDDGSI